MSHGAFGPTRGYPAEYDPATYTGPTAEPGAPLPGHDPHSGGTPPGYAAQFARGHPYLYPAFNVVLFELLIPVGNGAEGNWVVPQGCIALVQSAFFNFVSDATVGTRDVSIEYRLPNSTPSSGSHIGEFNVNTSTYTASSNRETSLSIWGVATYVNDSLINGPLPIIWLPEGCSFGLTSGGTGGTGDKFSNGPHCSAIVMPRPAEYIPPPQQRP